MASLESLWKEGRDGALSPLEQMRAWALRTAQSDLGGDKAVNYEKIAERVTKVGGGHPTREAIRRFLERVDADPEWSCAGGPARADLRGRTCAGGRAGALSTGSAPS